MPLNAREYRDYLYENQAHPHHARPVEKKEEGFSGLYLTLFPFLVAEYFAELHYDRLPSGIVFPLGYVLFWAFYYTYYQPGFLEEKLSEKKKWDLLSVPTVLLGALIWFVKVCVVEFSEKVILNSLLGLSTKRAQPKAPRQQPQPPPQERRFHAHANPHFQQRPQPQNGLPRDLENALAILGLAGCREWSIIQKRYRELAKKFHPDLDPDITQVGNRFMIYDAAYRKLEAAKAKFFRS
jgi:hypothetical protein